MENSKLLDLLRVLLPKEIARLGDFLRSPFFNKQEMQIRLFEEMIRFAPEYQSPLLNKEAVFARIFGETTIYNDSKMRLLMSDAVKLVEKFIAISVTENTEVSQGIELMRFYAIRQPKYFEATLKLTKQANQKYLKADSARGYFYNNYLIELSKTYYQSTTNPTLPNSNHWESAKALDIYFLACKLQDYCQMYSLKQSITVNEPLHMVELILHYIEVHHYNDIPILKIWYSAFYVITKSDDHHFELLRQYLIEHAGIINDKDLRNLYMWANNFCNMQFNQGNSHYYPIALELYREQIDSKIIYVDGVFPHAVFKNIVTIALRSQKIDWASSFIHDYYSMLPAPLQLLTYHYSLAQVCLAKQDYPLAQEHIWEAQQQQNKDLYHKIGIYRLWIKLYYLTGETEQLENTLNSFRVFMHREKTVTETSLQANRNFTNVMFKMLELPFLPVKKTEQVEQQLLAFDYVAERDWLHERIKEVKSKNRVF